MENRIGRILVLIIFIALISCSITAAAESLANIPGETANENTIETADESPGENPSETAAEISGETDSEIAIETAAENPGETASHNPVETSAETADESPGENPSETAAEISGETDSEITIETAAENPDETASHNPVETSAETADESPGENPSETAAEISGETDSEIAIETAAENPGETASHNSAKNPNETASHNPVETSAETPTENPAENPSKTPAGAPTAPAGSTPVNPSGTPAAPPPLAPPTPSLNAYGFYNQDFFMTFDSGIDGAFVEPIFGELITPDPDMPYQYHPVMQAQMQILQDTDDLTEKALSGAKTGEPETPAQRMHDLYDSLLNRDTDAEAEDAEFLALISPLIDAQDPEAFRAAADELYLSTGIHVLYNISVALEGSGTNRILPIVSPAAFSLAEKIAFDPVSEEKYADAYQSALGEYAKAIGLDLNETELAEAFSMQTAIRNTPDDALRSEFANSRRERASAEEGSYSQEAFDADMERLSQLHPGRADLVRPEGISKAESDVYSKRYYFDLDSRVVRSAHDTNAPDEISAILQTLRSAGFSNAGFSNAGFSNATFSNADFSNADFSTEAVIITPPDYEMLKNISITDQNLDACKLNAVLIFGEKAGYIPTSCKPAVQAMFEAADRAVWGSDNAPANNREISEESARAEVLKLLPQDPGLLWALEKYDTTLTEKVESLIEDIKATYIKRFQANDWLTDEEKQVFLYKLENMISVVGIPTPENYVFPVIVPRSEGGTWLTNRIAIFRRNLQLYLRLANEEDFFRKYYGQRLDYDNNRFITANLLNAVPNNSADSIIVPAAIIQYFADITEDDLQFDMINAFVVGHEIGHLFDSGGSLFDKYGVVTNWWSDGSREYYQGIIDEFAAHYDRFKIAGGLNQDFFGDYSECLADYAGFQVALDMIGDDIQAQEEFFRILAVFARSVYSRSELENFTNEFIADNHPYGPLRFNALITCADGFYELFDISEDAPMYTAPELRLKLW